MLVTKVTEGTKAGWGWGGGERGHWNPLRSSGGRTRVRTPEFCVSTKPGRAACETRCPRQGAVFSAPRSGRGRRDREGTLGPALPHGAATPRLDCAPGLLPLKLHFLDSL